MSFMSLIAFLRSATLNFPDEALNSWPASSASPSPTRLTFSELEPALTTRTFTGPGSMWPGPVADVGGIVADFAGVLPVPHPLVLHELADGRGLRSQPVHAVDHVHDEMEAVEVVEHHHVERRRRRSLFFV